jgi:hypothetical protein
MRADEPMQTDDDPTRREFDSLSRTVERLDHEFSAFRESFPDRIVGPRLYEANRESDRLNNARQDHEIEKLQGIVAWVVRSLVSAAFIAPVVGWIWNR